MLNNSLPKPIDFVKSNQKFTCTEFGFPSLLIPNPVDFVRNSCIFYDCKLMVCYLPE